MGVGDVKKRLVLALVLVLLGRVGPRVIGGDLYDSPLWDSDGIMTEYGEMYREAQ